MEVAAEFYAFLKLCSKKKFLGTKFSFIINLSIKYKILFSPKKNGKTFFSFNFNFFNDVKAYFIYKNIFSTLM